MTTPKSGSRFAKRPAETGKNMFIDAHSHLDRYKDDLKQSLDEINQHRIFTISNSMDIKSYERNLEIAAKSSFVLSTFGVHPWNAAEYVNRLKDLDSAIAQSPMLGEIGLDYHKKVIAIAPKELQKSVLREILVIAKKYQKPVTIHCRYAWRDALVLIEEAEVEKAVFHWYTGPSSVLKDIVCLGYFISATPAAEYHQEHRRAVKAVSLENLLIETDSPVSYGTELKWRAVPADTLRTLKAVAEMRGASAQELAQTTTNNAIKFFDLPFRT